MITGPVSFVRAWTWLGVVGAANREREEATV